MKRILVILVITLVNLPLQATTFYINTGRNSVYIVVSPFDPYSAQQRDAYYGAYGIHNGLGPNSGRSVNHYYTVPINSGQRYEILMNNSGTGSHGPGTY